MSDQKSINRRELLAQLAFTFAGATVIGPTMAKAIEDTLVGSFVEMARASPADYNPRKLSRGELEENLRTLYRQKSAPPVRRVTTALGAFIGYVSHDKSSKAGNALNRDRDFY